jgi:Tfp pilus assembly protein FimT
MASPEASTAVVFFGMSLDMMIGMALGMIASPLMMKGIKIIRHRRKMNRLFNEIAQARQNDGIDNNLLSSSDNGRKSPLRK